MRADKRIKLAITLVAFLIVLFLAARSFVYAKIKYSHFKLQDEITIFLSGDEDNNENGIEEAYSVNELITRFRKYNPDYAIIDKQYDIYNKKDELYEERIKDFDEQIDKYSKAVNEAVSVGDIEVQKYYEDLLKNTRINKANSEYEKEINRFYIDNKATLVNREKQKVKAEFIKNLHSLVRLNFQIDYFKTLKAYRKCFSRIKKIQFEHEKIMLSEYNKALSDLYELNAKIYNLKEKIRNLNAYIRRQTKIASFKDLKIVIPLFEAKSATEELFKKLTNSFYNNNLDRKYLSHQISCKENLINDLVSIYGEETTQTELMKLEVEQLKLKLLKMQSEEEQQKENIIYRFKQAKNMFEALQKQAEFSGQIFFEKNQLYKIGLSTELSWYESKADMNNAIYTAYSYYIDILDLIYEVKS